MEYLVIFEHEGSSWGAYLPDLPGCVAVGDNEAEVRQLIHEAIELHISAMREHGETVPLPTSKAELVRVA